MNWLAFFWVATFLIALQVGGSSYQCHLRRMALRRERKEGETKPYPSVDVIDLP